MATACSPSLAARSTPWKPCPTYRSATPGARCRRSRFSRPDGCASGHRPADGANLAVMSMTSDRVLTQAELRGLSGRTNADGAMRLGTHVALLAGTGWLVAVAGPWTLLPAVLLLG